LPSHCLPQPRRSRVVSRSRDVCRYDSADDHLPERDRPTVPQDPPDEHSRTGTTYGQHTAAAPQHQAPDGLRRPASVRATEVKSEPSALALRPRRPAKPSGHRARPAPKRLREGVVPPKLEEPRPEAGRHRLYQGCARGFLLSDRIASGVTVTFLAVGVVGRCGPAGGRPRQRYRAGRWSGSPRWRGLGIVRARSRRSGTVRVGALSQVGGLDRLLQLRSWRPRVASAARVRGRVGSRLDERAA